MIFSIYQHNKRQYLLHSSSRIARYTQKIGCKIIQTFLRCVFNTSCSTHLQNDTSFGQRSLCLFAHSSCAMSSSSAMFLGLRAATAFFRSHHRFLIGFKSGDCDGHSRAFLEPSNFFLKPILCGF